MTKHVPIWLKSPEMTLPDASELLLIRHAPALHDGRLCGRMDVPADLGEAAVWEPLQALVSEIDHRVVSPALRCRQTAHALWPAATPEQDARLWEQDFGAHDGLRFDEIPDIGALSSEELAEHRPPGGESFADMVARVWPALEELAEKARQAGPVAVVAHAGTVRAGLALALGAVPPALGFEVAPWSVTRLRAYPGGLSVISTNWRPI
ncbi:histidine phosphatase family protein [Mameliella sp. MMSF_3552]|uniref:histidine phosphatase family protein n=2 Tax=unclassified Mameliella TaxID=2630630 RepID=UPI00353206EC